MTHWHIAHGIAGYGPDGANGYGTALTANDAAECARDELRDSVDYCEETARSLADDGQYEEAWREHERAETLDVLRANLSTERANAPLYQGDPALWEEALRGLLAGFPVDVSHSGRLYVWECDDEGCGHLAEMMGDA